MRWIQDSNNFFKKSIMLFITLLLCFTFCIVNVQAFVPGGKVTIHSTVEPDSLNPLFSESRISKEILNLVMDGLVNIDENGHLTPNLAISVPTLENQQVKIDKKVNKMVVTYKLRPQVMWHDGYPFTSEDIEFTWRSFTNPSIGIPDKKGYQYIEKIELIDKLTLKLYFSKIYPDYYLLFDHILPKHVFKSNFFPPDLKHPFTRFPIGTGPFVFHEWKKGEHIILDYYEDYHKGRPVLDQIVYNFSNVNKSSLPEIVKKSDITQNIPILLFPYIKNMNISFTYTPSFLMESLDMNMKSSILADIRVRRALAYAINKKELINEVFWGLLIPANTHQYTYSDFSNPRIKNRYPHNIEKAKNLLKEAGFIFDKDKELMVDKEGKPLKFNFAIIKNNRSHELVADYLKYNMEEIGVTLEINPVSSYNLFNTVLPRGFFDLALYPHKVGPKPDLYSRWHSSQIPPIGKNYTRFIDPDTDRLITDAGKTMDSIRRKLLYQKVSEYLMEFVPTIPLYYHVNIDTRNKKIHNFRPNIYTGNTWNSYEWWKDY